MSKTEFEFPVQGATISGWGSLVQRLVSQNQAMGTTLSKLQDVSPECQNERRIADFVVGLMLVIAENPVKSDPVYAYVRREVAENDFLEKLASMIIVLYDVEVKKRDTVTEVENVRDAIRRVRLA
jgi:hypothetical protein